jgi:hypothetical protein
MGFIETSVASYQTSLRKMPEERKPQLHRSGSPPFEVKDRVLCIPDFKLSPCSEFCMLSSG